MLWTKSTKDANIVKGDKFVKIKLFFPKIACDMCHSCGGLQS